MVTAFLTGGAGVYVIQATAGSALVCTHVLHQRELVSVVAFLVACTYTRSANIKAEKSTFFGRIVYMLFDQLYKYRTRNREIGRDLIYFSCIRTRLTREK
ncbi:hypothetical protein BDV35DRAFT_192888 [Aspergillus flavus]|uniref:Uncharacterized protein n=1 Tax=Aspergillus flavus TaxID=5059 RepID=A0A5N6GYU6_ASPFL|nr:hypothetical protein BDV35DRAFT_192888 [Aspergillus flavus]